MNAQVLISHSASAAEIANQVQQALRAMIPGAHVACSSLPGREPAGGDDSLAALKAELASAHAVVGLITADALTSAEVPFQLGAGWALGKRVILLLSPEERANELYLPMGHAESFVLGPESLIEVAQTLGTAIGVQAEVGPAANALLMDIFPGWEGPRRDSSERPVPSFSPPREDDTQQMWLLDQAERAKPSPAPRAGLPSADAALKAGTAISTQVWDREDGGPGAEDIDSAFGGFVAALGADWDMLRRIGDLEVWLEAADNVLGTLDANEQHVRGWYGVGYQATLLLNLARRQLELEGPDEALEKRWHSAWTSLRESAWHARLAPAAIDELHAMLENLRGPARDYTNLGRAQARVAELAQLAQAAAS